VVHINLAEHGILPAGELSVTLPSGVPAQVSVFDATGEMVVDQVFLRQGEGLATLLPGEYQLVARQQDDPYPAEVMPVSVAAQQTTRISVSELPLSTRLQLDSAQAQHTQVERHMQAQDAISTYDRATTTAGVNAARGDVQQWGMMFSLSAIIGGVSSLTGTGMLTLGPNQGTLIQERNELDRRINTLSADAARKQAENALFGRSFP